jgi:nucleoside 2-deoxyribosyltransferase
MTNPEPFSIYFAGALFKFHDLSGNVLLGNAIARRSKKRYSCVLPQDLEQADFRAVAIRNTDLLHVVTADLCIFNYDGTDLDSGTVVEAMMAKLLDIPSVLVRTDFRSSGDQNKDGNGNQWNLMCSGYPRNEVVVVHGMASYHQEFRAEQNPEDGLIRYADAVANPIVEALDRVRQLPPVYSAEEAEWAYKLGIKFPGSGFDQLFPGDSLARLIAAKRARGLL